MTTQENIMARIQMDIPDHQPLFVKHLLQLLDPTITLENVLKSFSIPCLAPSAYNCEDVELIVIFLAYIRFIITRQHGACIDGIWEDILKKTLKYTQNFSHCTHRFPTMTLSGVLDQFRRGIGSIFDIQSYNKIVPTKGLPVETWFNEALSSCSKCPNPYIRLELFRLYRLFFEFLTLSEEHLCSIFIHTICEIQPHHLYSCIKENDILFSAIDMDYVIDRCCDVMILQKIISTNLIKHLNETNDIDDCKETKFLSHCIQIIGAFATKVNSNPVHRIKFMELKYCCMVFKNIGKLVDCGEYLPGRSRLYQFRYIISITHPLFRKYVVETIQELTAAIYNYRQGDRRELLMSLRDSIAEDLGVYHNTCTLPSLLLTRQIQGPTLIHKHFLLLRRLGGSYIYLKRPSRDNDVSEDFDDNKSTVYINDRNMGRSECLWRLRSADEDKSSSSSSGSDFEMSSRDEWSEISDYSVHSHESRNSDSASYDYSSDSY